MVPLFILMGVVASRSGMSGELYRAANAVFSGMRGALAMGTVGACAGFGAICGSSLATAATMTPVAMPGDARVTATTSGSQPASSPPAAFSA